MQADCQLPATNEERILCVSIISSRIRSGSLVRAMSSPVEKGGGAKKNPTNMIDIQCVRARMCVREQLNGNLYMAWAWSSFRQHLGTAGIVHAKKTARHSY